MKQRVPRAWYYCQRVLHCVPMLADFAGQLSSWGCSESPGRHHASGSSFLRRVDQRPCWWCEGGVVQTTTKTTSQQAYGFTRHGGKRAAMRQGAGLDRLARAKTANRPWGVGRFPNVYSVMELEFLCCVSFSTPLSHSFRENGNNRHPNKGGPGGEGLRMTGVGGGGSLGCCGRGVSQVPESNPETFLLVLDPGRTARRAGRA